MKYFRTKSSEVRAIEDGQEHLVEDDWVELTIKEVNDLLNPPKTDEQLKDAASQARDQAMLEGFEYNGKQISVTSDDGGGMLQVEATFKRLKNAILNGVLPSDYPIKTVIRFKNGTELPMTEEEFETFSLKFILERGKFFQ